jgi:hypothetical protein
MAAAHKGLHNRIYATNKHPEAYLGHLSGLVSALLGKEMAYWHNDALSAAGSDEPRRKSSLLGKEGCGLV